MPHTLRPLFPTKLPPLISFTHKFFRASLSIQAWLSIGAILQGLLFLLPIRPSYALAPAALYLLIQATDTILITVGLKRNYLLARAIPHKYSAVIPRPDGTLAAPTQDKICVFILGFQCYHPLGPFAPKSKEMGDYAARMYAQIENAPKEWGYMGHQAFVDDRGAYQIMYFKNAEGPQLYAQSLLHREAWDWFNKITKENPHLGIMHESFEAPAGKWETIYGNMEPVMFATSRHVVKSSDGSEKLISGVVDASKGIMASAKGRMS